MKEQDIPEFLEGCGLLAAASDNMPEACELLKDASVQVRHFKVVSNITRTKFIMRNKRLPIYR